jgi:hypothetical protein
MKDIPRFPTAEDVSREKELETELFGKPVEKNSILEEIYAYLHLEDIEQIQIDFNLNASEFNAIETKDQWGTLAPHLSTLRHYKAKRDGLGENIDEIRKLKSETRPTIEAIKKILQGM